MKLKQIRNTVLTLVLIAVSFGAGWKLNQIYHKYKLGIPNFSSLPSFTQSDLFTEVYQLLNQSYLEKDKLKDQEQLLYGSVQGMVAALGDPYTVFLPPKDNQQFKEDMAGSFDGVGIELGYKDSQLAVIAPLEGTPAEKAGVQPGDIIIHIKDEQKDFDKDSLNLSLAEAVEIIRGPKGSSIFLTLAREGMTEPIKVEITRDEIVIPRVTLETINRNSQEIAHVKLARFGDNTIEQWNEVTKQILSLEEKNNFAGIILDLRNNPGGYLDGAVYIASEFIGQGVIVHQESSEGSRQTFSVDHQGQLTQTPLVVIVNQGSASAAEIVAGALKEQKGATIIGQTTFGKGTIQQSNDLDNNASIHITIARWLLPSGTQIHEQGITPDIEVDNSPDTEEDEILQAALDQLVGN
jgi:carboxyl-terminal processing protease